MADTRETTDAVVEVEGTDLPSASYAKAIASEYGRYAANGPLSCYGAPAFAADQAVPASHPMVPVWLADGSIRAIEA